MQTSTCPCHRCRPRKPRDEWGINSRGEWRQLSTYFAQYAEERWQIRLERKAKHDAAV